METTLRMFYARAIPLLLAFGSLLVIVLTSATVALAQDATPAAPEGSTKDLIDLVFSSASAFAVSMAGLLFVGVLKTVPSWGRPILEYLTTSEADRWERLLTAGLDRAKEHTRRKLGEVADRSSAIETMTGFLNAFYPEIVRWADQNKNGVIDLIEPYLPPTPSRKAAPAPASAFMDAQDKRGAGALRQKGPQH